MPAGRHARTRRSQTNHNPNIRQVAELAGVSTATVSRVLAGQGGVSDELIEKVHAAIRALDYHPNRTARNLRRRVTQTVGVVISDIQNPFFTSVIGGIEKVLDAAGYTLLLCNSDEDPKREKAHMTTLRAEGVAGIILASTRADTEVYRQMLEAGIPLVAIDRLPGQLNLDVVTVTNMQGARSAVAHLAELGHRRIALISGPCQISTSRERQKGYEQALRERGLAVSPELIQFSNFRQAGGYEAMLALLALPAPPTAVLVSNNLMTLGALQAIHERGLRIPSDMAVVGFDDMPWATSLQPPLTVVAQPTFALGEAAARLLLDRLGDPNRPCQHVVLETQLVVRASSGSAGGAAGLTPGN